MTDCERTALYFDGELPPDQEAAALAHLTGCAACQAELGDFMGLEVALSRGRRAAAPRRRWRVGAVAAGLAAALALWWLRAEPVPGPQPIALAEVRPVEARLTAPAFDHHRPYRVPRSGAGRELIPLDALAALEHRGDTAGLAAAHVLGGDLARATSALDAAPATPARDSDRAAVALVAGDPVAALRWTDAALAAAPALASARWNRALALQALDLTLTAAAELDAVAARGEPGWSGEARSRADAMRVPMVARGRDLAAYQAAAAAMIAGTGPAVPADVAQRHPGLARRDLFDALAAAGSADAARALAPLAVALDRVARSDHASRAVAAVAARDFAVRRRFHERYRALVDGTLDDAARAALIAELARAGAAAGDILVGAILLSPPNAADLPALRRAIPPDDPWFAIELARREAQARATAGDSFGAEAALVAALPACREPAWALVCGQGELDLGELYLRMRRLEEGDARLRDARAAFAAAGAPQFEDFVLTARVNLERLRDRDAVASADLEEIRLRAPASCDNTRFVDEGQAVIAFDAGDFTTARRRMPAPGVCGAPPDAATVILAVDLARLGDPGDRDRAEAMLAAARAAPGSPAVAAAVGSGRLMIDRDPAAGAAEVRRGLAGAAALTAEPGTAGEQLAWGYATLISDAGRRADWPGALALFEDELGGPARAGCLVAASVDNERATVVVRASDGALRGSYQAARSIAALDTAARVPPARAGALAGCPEVAVIARPPLHGRDDLVPAELAWSFVSPRRAVAAPSAARRVIVSGARPPVSLGLPPLAAITDATAVALTGADATPARVLAELRDATYLEIHAHGIPDASDAAFVALSPDGDGRFALTAAQLRTARFAGAPIVVLAACHSARTGARYRLTRWSLPDAFLAAGARAVIAASTAIPDDQGAALFGELRARLDRGEPPARAVAALRTARLAAGQRWAAGLLVFE